MRYFLFIYISGFLLISGCSSQSQDNMNYSVKITNYYFVRINHVTILNNDSIQSEMNKTNANKSNQSRKLTENEKKSIIRFFNKFPLNELHNQYINEQVEDGTQIKFEIRIENIEKEIYISNEYQEDLGKLVRLITSLLPEDYIGYSKEIILK